MKIRSLLPSYKGLKGTFNIALYWSMLDIRDGGCWFARMNTLTVDKYIFILLLELKNIYNLAVCTKDIILEIPTRCALLG
jgi:hypothetical protein